MHSYILKIQSDLYGAAAVAAVPAAPARVVLGIFEGSGIEPATFIKIELLINGVAHSLEFALDADATGFVSQFQDEIDGVIGWGVALVSQNDALEIAVESVATGSDRTIEIAGLSFTDGINPVVVDIGLYPTAEGVGSDEVAGVPGGLGLAQRLADLEARLAAANIA